MNDTQQMTTPSVDRLFSKLKLIKIQFWLSLTNIYKLIGKIILLSFHQSFFSLPGQEENC